MKFSICSFLFPTAMGDLCYLSCLNPAKNHVSSGIAHFCQVAEGERGDTHVFLTKAEFFGSSPAFCCIGFAQPTAANLLSQQWQERCNLVSAYVKREASEQVASSQGWKWFN